MALGSVLLATASWRCLKNFSQRQRSFQWQLRSHWLKILGQRHVAGVIQDSNLVAPMPIDAQAVTIMTIDIDSCILSRMSLKRLCPENHSRDQPDKSCRRLIAMPQDFLLFYHTASDACFEISWPSSVQSMYFLSRIHDDVIKWKYFRVVGPLWGESTGHQWIPLTKANDMELWYFLWSITNGWASNRDAGDLRRHRAHYDVTVIHRL